MLAYRIMLVSGALLPAGLLAVMLLHTGWEAVAAVATVLAGLALLISSAVVAAEGDRLRPRMR